MTNEIVQLANSDFRSSATNTLKKLWNDTNFADVTLATADNTQIHAHKIILSTFSPFFENILFLNPHPKPLIYLRDIRHQDLNCILQFLYLGECEVNQIELEAFLASAKELKISGLENNLSIVEHELKLETIKPSYNESYKTHLNKDKNFTIQLEENADCLSEVRTIKQCKACNRQFKYRKSLVAHTIKYHGSKPPIFNCTACNKTFSRQENLHRHGETHTIKEKCDVCEAVFTNSRRLKCHKFQEHTVKKCKIEDCRFEGRPGEIRKHKKRVNHFVPKLGATGFKSETLCEDKFDLGGEGHLILG